MELCTCAPADRYCASSVPVPVRVQVSLSAAYGAASLAELIDYLMVPPQDVVSIEAVLAPLFELLVAVRASPLTYIFQQ